MKKWISLLLIAALLCPLLTGCAKESTCQMLSFSQAQSVEEMKKLDGKQVTIIGYMSTLSPVSGTFMYLMNLPYQSCPFCVPNTTQLSNTMAVYAKSSKGFEFTDRAIQVVGVLEFGDFTDEFGYEYAYRIKDATYTILDTENMSRELKLWQQLASTDVIGQVYTMFEYVNFLCHWPTYTAKFGDKRDYLYPTDALKFIETEGAQFHYGFQEGYFADMIATIEQVDPDAFAALEQVIRDAEALSQTAYSELKNGNYTMEQEYSTAFGDGRTQYRMVKHQELESQMEKLYRSFSHWLSGWEL